MAIQRRRESQIWLVMKKEFQLLWKDKKTLLIYFLGPILIVSAIGSTGGVSLGGKEALTAAIVNQDSSTIADDLAAKFISSDHLTAEMIRTEKRAIDELKREDVQAVVVIPEKFGDSIQNGQNASLKMYIDNTDTYVPQSSQLAATEILAEFQKDLAKKMNVTSGGSISLETDKFYEGEWKQIDMVSAKVFPLVLVWVPMMMTGMTIVSERIRGTLSRSLKTPLSRLNMIIGKLMAYVPIAVAQIILIVSFARAVFDLEISGSVVDVFLILLMTALVGMSIGMVVSVLGTTDRQVTEAIPIIVLVLINLAGVFIPLRMMPETMQTIAKFVPLRYSIRAMNGALLKGYGMEYIGGEILILLLFALGILALAIVLFHFEEKTQQIMRL